MLCINVLLYSAGGGVAAELQSLMTTVTVRSCTQVKQDTGLLIRKYSTAVGTDTPQELFCKSIDSLCTVLIC